MKTTNHIRSRPSPPQPDRDSVRDLGAVISEHRSREEFISCRHCRLFGPLVVTRWGPLCDGCANQAANAEEDANKSA